MRLLPFVWVLVASTAAAETPTETARKLVDIQVKDMLARTDLSIGPILDGDVMLLTSQNTIAWVDESPRALMWAVTDGSPHSELRTAKVTSVVGGGDDKVVWLTARSRRPAPRSPSSASSGRRARTCFTWARS